MEILQQRAEIAHLKLWIAIAAPTPVRSARRASGHAPQPTRTPVGRAGNRRGRNRPSNRPGELRSCPHPRPHPPRFRAPSRRHLPRDVCIHQPDTAVCPDCGGPLKPLGEDASELLEYVPAAFRVIRHVRPKHACGRCDRIVQAPAPPRPIARGLAGPSLLAHVLVSKYSDHLPLYRQSEIYARSGVDLSRSTLARSMKWVVGRMSGASFTISITLMKAPWRRTRSSASARFTRLKPTTGATGGRSNPRPPRPCRSSVGRLPDVASDHPIPGLAKIGVGRGDPLRSDSLDGLDPLPRRRAVGDRQQRRGAFVATGGARTEELSVRRL